MSLKAKIEAVIYASEEPVTLAQLAGLLGHEAQAELDHRDAAQHSLALDLALDQADSPSGLGEPEPSHPDAFREHLHEAAADEAAHLSTLRRHSAADEAAMSTADSLDEPESATQATEAAGQGSEAPADVSRPEPLADAEEHPKHNEEKELERKLAREARDTREKDRRLREYFRGILDQLIAEYATSDRGLEIREVAGGYRLATKPEYHDAVRGFVKSLKPPLKLTLQALETLAVVAYKQPVTAPEVSEIRGVDSGGVLGSLMARKLVVTAGRKQVIGRPILYKTTKDFLVRFGLKDLNELPSIEEFEKMAGELAEQEEIPMEHHAHHAPENAAEVERERDQTEPQADGDSSSIGETVADEAVVDGRLSGLPPNYADEDAGDDIDSPAHDAQIQRDEETNG